MRQRRSPLRAFIVCLICAQAVAAQAVSLDEAVVGDFSNNRFAPTAFPLDFSGPTPGHNVLSGTLGATGTADRDYLRVVVPEGFFWTELRVGNQTTTGGTGSFIGLAAGGVVPVAPEAASAAGLIGWWLYRTADRGTDILDNMAVAASGSSGFARPLPAGEYGLWLQELAPGSYPYRFNFILSPVSEPSAMLLLLSGLLALPRLARRRS